MGKKITVALVLALCMIFGLVASADGRRVSMEIRDVECSADEDITVLVMVVGTEGSSRIGFEVSYDPEAFSFISADYGTGANGFTIEKEEDSDGVLTIGGVADTMSASTGTFAKLTMHVSADASGEYEFILSELTEYCAGATTLSVTNGIVTVSGTGEASEKTSIDDDSEESEASDLTSLVDNISFTDGDGEDVAFSYEVDEAILVVSFEMPETGVLFEMPETEEVEMVLLDDGTMQYLVKADADIFLAIGANVLEMKSGESEE